MNTLSVSPNHHGWRLDKFLTNHHAKYSRSAWQKKIKHGEVMVNDKQITPHYFLKVNDQITITSSNISTTPSKITNDLVPKIITDTNNFLVLDKPAGLLVHPVNLNDLTPTLADWLIKKYPSIKEIGEDLQRPGIVHRLDKDVSGLLVIAKNQEMFDQLKTQFQERKITKEYLALVHGKLSQPDGEINFPISRSSTNEYRMAAHPKNQAGKQALTKYEVIKKIKNYSLLKVQIITGRTNQIRVHLNALGHPIVGDTIYHPKKIKLVDLGRLFLHAHYLGFTDLDKKFLEFRSELPEKLQQFLEELG